MSSFEREERMERGLEGRMGWMEGGCWELDAVQCEARGWKRWVLRRGDVKGMPKKEPIW